MTHPCPHCDGTGREGDELSGLCGTCAGRGRLHESVPPAPRPVTERQVLWYLTDTQYAEHTAANERTRREVEDRLDWLYLHTA